MNNQKIMLFFEDNINISKFNKDNIFVNKVISALPERYIVSKNYGKFGQSKTKLGTEQMFYFAKNNPFDKQSCIYPENELKNTNSRDIFSLMPGMKGDEIPFFVLDTDGVEISNFSQKILGLANRGRQDKKPDYFSGIGDLLPKIIQLIYDDAIFSDNPRWGLILVNPASEGSFIGSINKNVVNFKEIMFGGKNNRGVYQFSNLQISYWNKGNNLMRFIASSEGKKLNLSSGNKDFIKMMTQSLGRNDKLSEKKKVGNALNTQIIDIWDELKVIEPDIFDDAISLDISEHYKIIVDSIVDNQNFSHLVNNNKYKNAKNSVFSIYLKKRKIKRDGNNPKKLLKDPDYPGGLPHKKFQIIERNAQSNNFDIQEFEFG